jgi:hypothetical protein
MRVEIFRKNRYVAEGGGMQRWNRERWTGREDKSVDDTVC